MLDVKVDVLEAGITATRTALRDGLLSLDIFDSNGLSIAGWNPNAAASALFTQVTNDINEALANSAAPQLKDYYYVDLKDAKSVVIINHGAGLLQCWYLDSAKVNPGILLGMAIPKALASAESARADSAAAATADASLQLNLILQSSKMGLWDMIVDPKDPTGAKNAFTWTPEFRAMLGYKDEADFPNVLDSWSNRLHPDHHDRTLEAFGAHLNDKTAQIPYDVEYMLQRKNGEYRWYRATGETTRAPDGTPLRVVGVLRDIHDERTRTGDKQWKRRT